MKQRQILGRLLRAALFVMSPHYRSQESYPYSGMDLANVNWSAMIRTADRHLILPALGEAVCHLEVIARNDPYRDFLDGMRSANQTRNSLLLKQVLTLAKVLNDDGTEPLLLKGAIRLIDDLYPTLAWRFMSDIDFLVPGDEIENTCQQLRKLGYTQHQRAEYTKDHHHLPAFFCSVWPATVELHTAFGIGEVTELLPPSEVYKRSQLINVDGTRIRVPSFEDQALHAIAHVFLNNFSFLYPCCSLRDILEIYLLLLKQEGDFSGIRERLSKSRREWVLDSCFIICSDDLEQDNPTNGLTFSRLIAKIGSLELESRKMLMIRFLLAGIVRAIILEKRSPGKALEKILSKGFVYDKLFGTR